MEQAILAELDTIPVKGRAPKTGYQRDLFGQAWSDDVSVADGHNGCDTRNDILRRDLDAIALKPGSNGCTVLTGNLEDPYTGTVLQFVRGPATSSLVQIDHVVALSDAWQKGAQSWDADTMRNFANDPLNLLATDGTTNRQKGAGDAASWLPPDRTFWCVYVGRQVAVKAAYGLWMTQAEWNRIHSILTGPCDGGANPIAPAAPERPTESSISPPDFANCSQVWAALERPIHRGEPGYRSRFDGDGDGVGCENRPG